MLGIPLDVLHRASSRDSDVALAVELIQSPEKPCAAGEVAETLGVLQRDLSEPVPESFVQGRVDDGHLERGDDSRRVDDRFAGSVIQKLVGRVMWRIQWGIA
jgi:hypothetical protein